MRARVPHFGTVNFFRACFNALADGRVKKGGLSLVHLRPQQLESGKGAGNNCGGKCKDPQARAESPRTTRRERR